MTPDITLSGAAAARNSTKLWIRYTAQENWQTKPQAFNNAKLAQSESGAAIALIPSFRTDLEFWMSNKRSQFPSAFVQSIVSSSHCAPSSQCAWISGLPLIGNLFLLNLFSRVIRRFFRIVGVIRHRMFLRVRSLIRESSAPEKIAR